MRVTVATPLGPLTVAGDREAVREISFGASEASDNARGAVALAARELEAYFLGRLRAFSFPMAPRGTAFQKRVWEQLTSIGYGETRTYGQLAQALGCPKAARAVGTAAHQNPIAIAVPCHRLVGAKGLTGYAGGLDKKAWLLAHEQKNSENGTLQKAEDVI